MERRLYVSWQDVESRQWSTVGLLTHEDSTGYVFRYVQGAQQARKEYNFSGIAAFPDLSGTYQSEELFSFFANRIMSSDRPEYELLIEQVDLAPEGDPNSPKFVFDYLRRTRGWRATDSYEMFAPAGKTDGGYRWDFFTRGIRHGDKAISKKWTEEQPVEPLRPVVDMFNDFDPNAVMIVDREHRFLGFVPATYSEVIRGVLDAADKVEIEILRQNKETELVQKRFLLALDVKTPTGFKLDIPEDHRPLSEESPDCESA